MVTVQVNFKRNIEFHTWSGVKFGRSIHLEPVNSEVRWSFGKEWQGGQTGLTNTLVLKELTFHTFDVTLWRWLERIIMWVALTWNQCILIRMKMLDVKISYHCAVHGMIKWWPYVNADGSWLTMVPTIPFSFRGVSDSSASIVSSLLTKFRKISFWPVCSLEWLVFKPFSPPSGLHQSQFWVTAQYIKRDTGTC